MIIEIDNLFSNKTLTLHAEDSAHMLVEIIKHFSWVEKKATNLDEALKVIESQQFLGVNIVDMARIFC